MHALFMYAKLVCVVNDSRSAENEILQLMLYRDTFLPPDPSTREVHGPLVRKMEELDQRLADAHSRTFVDSDDARARGDSHNIDS